MPREKRHIKSTYANQTPATDGETVVAFFGSQGLYAYDMKGALRWKQDLGVLNAGAYDLPEYEWGNASSPIVADGRVIVQCDVHGGSFLQAFDVKTGRSLWKTERTELPSWATPTVVDGPRGKELVTNAPNFIRGYDPATGEQLWQLGGSSKITAPTPILARDLVIVASGRGPSGRSSRSGPAAAATSRWPPARPPASRLRGAAPSAARTCRPRWRTATSSTRLPTRDCSTPTPSPAAPRCTGSACRMPAAASAPHRSPPTDGCSCRARTATSSSSRRGATFELLAKNVMTDPIMATPAIAGSLLIVRTEKQLVAIGQ